MKDGNVQLLRVVGQPLHAILSLTGQNMPYKKLTVTPSSRSASDPNSSCASAVLTMRISLSVGMRAATSSGEFPIMAAEEIM